ncbi:uncharacterized protein LOC143025451 [Oratosquilla oratoria]|uniref:uncharacterized protein LOC143025451 n=1 Tax=Oratosquilla oratoria TaxID=337810 RepID=UPI003F759001
MDTRIHFLGCVLLVVCVVFTVAIEANPHPIYRDEVPDYRGPLTNLFASRSKRAATHLDKGSRVVNVPRPCSELRVEPCPYPDLPGLCTIIDDSVPCSESEVLSLF